MSSTAEALAKRNERLDRLKNLHLKRNEARKLNHQEVVEEDKRSKLPKNYESKKRRTEWEEAQQKKKEECAAKGVSYDRMKYLDIGADEAEKWDRIKKQKKNPDEGFSDYVQATERHYKKLTKQIKPDMNTYEQEKEKMGEAFYPGVDTLGVTNHKDSKDAIDNMVEDINKQIDKRAKYSRRRMHDEEADIDYINERNKKFNQKLERFYGKHTSEIKQNLERGTAV